MESATMVKLIFILLFSVSAFAQFEEKKEMINQIVDSYRDDIIRTRGSDVKLIFNPQDIFQMTGGHIGNGKLEIKVYAGALKKFDNKGIVAAICHELGHILGKVPVGGTRVVSEDSVEGEADYFSGVCSRTYFCGKENTSCAEAVSASRNAVNTMSETVVNETLALNQIYPGINKTYPRPPCRLLSMILGVKGQSRPLCWYNPNYKPKPETRITLRNANFVRTNASCMYLMIHVGNSIQQTALAFNNQNCREVGSVVTYHSVDGYSNTYQASANDFLKIKSPTSLQFAQSVESLEMDDGQLYQATDA